jgi:hypothetical protein
MNAMWWCFGISAFCLAMAYREVVIECLKGLGLLIGWLVIEEPVYALILVVGGISYLIYGSPKELLDEPSEVQKVEVPIKDSIRLSNDITYNLGEIGSKYRVQLANGGNDLDFSADDVMGQLQKVFPNDGRLFVAPEVGWYFIGKSSLAIRSVEGHPVNDDLCVLINERASKVVDKTFGCVQAPTEKDTYIWKKL